MNQYSEPYLEDFAAGQSFGSGRLHELRVECEVIEVRPSKSRPEQDPSASRFAVLHWAIFASQHQSLRHAATLSGRPVPRQPSGARADPRSLPARRRERTLYGRFAPRGLRGTRPRTKVRRRRRARLASPIPITIKETWKVIIENG